MAPSARRRSSARSSAATATSTLPRTPCRRRCWPRPRSGRTTACPTTRGWLITVASRRLIDQLRSEQARAAGNGRGRRGTPPDRLVAPAADDSATGRDDALTLLLLCCHPALPPPAQVALTLRAVGGLSTAQIARAFLVPEATMAQRISRAKARLRQAGARFDASRRPSSCPNGCRRRARPVPDLHRGSRGQRRAAPVPTSA